MLGSKKYTDKELIDGCLNNQRKFQELLYKRYFSRMMSMCLRYTTDINKATEIINDGFLRVFKKIDKYSYKGSLEGWIRRLVYHSLSEHFKKHSKYLQFIVFEDYEKHTNVNALDQLYMDDLLQLVEQLPAASKAVFKLYAIDGYSHKEISSELGISVGTSKWHLNASRTKLKGLINQYNLAQNAG